MLRKVCKLFDYVASIEIVESLYIDAKKMFRANTNVHLYCGDSGKMISNVIDDSRKGRNVSKIIFWLDGHYSGGETGKGEKDTPIIEELNTIFNKIEDGCIILIDDARCYTHTGEFREYPTTDFLKSTVLKRYRYAKISIRNDIIRIII